ncbi:MAG: MBL fold metallo-hydrolase [Candidatus Omnitrophota bacterium]
MNIKIIFDKEKIDERLHAGWGISYLIGTVLFDTGENAAWVLDNLKILGVGLDSIKKIVLSHNHWDHRAALWQLLSLNKHIEAYVCPDFIKEHKDACSKYTFKEVNDFMQITEGIYTTGRLKATYKGDTLEEQALIVKTDKGLSVVCACAHPGIIEIVSKAKEAFPGERIYAVLGGFHLMGSDNRSIQYVVQEFKRLRVENVGPAHCTGYEAVQLLRQFYGKNFLEIKSGVSLAV